MPRRKLLTGLLLATGSLAVAAASAQTSGRESTAVASKSAAISCSSTMKLALVTPLTGGAGFLGNEQLSWAKYAVKRLAPGLGLKIKLVTGDTPVEQGAAPAQSLAQKYVAAGVTGVPA